MSERVNMASNTENFDDKKVPICLVPNSKENTVRVLGVLIDEHITLEHHAYSLKSKLGKGIFSLNSMKGILGKKQLKMIYFANFHSHLNYCSNLFNLLPNTLTEQIYLLQKKAIRIMSNSTYLAHTKPIFLSEEILPFRFLIEYNCTLFMYDYVNIRLPETFDNTYTFNWQNDVQYNLRNLHDFELTRTRYVYLDNHPLYLYPKLWNDLPQELKLIGSRSLFAKKLREHLFRKEF